MKGFKHKPRIFTKVFFPLWKRRKSRNKLLLNLHNKGYILSSNEKSKNTPKILANKKTYIYNKNLFQYQTREITTFKHDHILMDKTNDSFFNDMRMYVYNKLTKELNTINRLSRLTKKETFNTLKKHSNTTRRLVKQWQSRDKYLIKALFNIRSELKLLLISLLTLKGAKTRKYTSRVRYLTEIPLFLEDFKAQFLYAYICQLTNNKH